MRFKRRLRRASLVVALAGVLAAAGAAGVLANTVPGIPGDGPGEDSPFLPAGVPILHVHLNPHGFGWIRSTTPAVYLIDCPLACRRPVAAGTSITLEAHPQAGWKVSGWRILDAPSTLTCQGQVASICSFSMPGPTTGLPATGELEVVADLTQTG